MQKTYLLFDPESAEVRGPLTTSPEQIVWNTEGGKFRIFELETAEGWRSWERTDGGIVDHYNLDLIRRPLIAKIDGEADAILATKVPDGSRGALYAAKLVEARSGAKVSKPILAAEAEAIGVTVSELSELVLVREAEFVELAAKVEPIRAKIKKTVRDATDLKTLLSIAPVAWPAT